MKHLSNIPINNCGDPYKDLWAFILLTAINEIHSINKEVAEKAVIYIKSDSVWIGSFIWICEEVLNLDSNIVREKVLKRKKQNVGRLHNHTANVRINASGRNGLYWNGIPARHPCQIVDCSYRHCLECGGDISDEIKAQAKLCCRRCAEKYYEKASRKKLQDQKRAVALLKKKL